MQFLHEIDIYTNPGKRNVIYNKQGIFTGQSFQSIIKITD